MSSHSRPDHDQPITELCIVSRRDLSPVGFDILLSTYDAKEDCNLWPERFFGSRTERYLCFSRNVLRKYSSDADTVLVDMMLTGEKDIVPTGFTAIQQTRGSNDKATKKKIICMKMKPRNSVNIAICDVIMVSQKRNIPRNFNVKGDINGMSLCVRLASVLPSPLPLEKLPSPLHQQPPNQRLPQMQRLSMQPTWIPPQPPTFYDHYRQQPGHQSGVSNTIGMMPPMAGYSMQYSPDKGIEHRFTLLKDNPLKDVPFVLDKRFLELEAANQIQVTEVLYRSPVDLDNEYSYTFDKENEAVQRRLNSMMS